MTHNILFYSLDLVKKFIWSSTNGVYDTNYNVVSSEKL